MQCVCMAQFKTGFTAEEGYRSGDIGTHLNWKASPNSFFVNPEGKGTLVIRPSETWRICRFMGEGGELTRNNYTATSRFTVKFKEGTTSQISGAAALNFTLFENSANKAEIAGGALRKVERAETFNVFVVSKLNLSNLAAFSNGFNASSIGLSVDDNGNWLDGESDLLESVYNLRYDPSSKSWEQTFTLKNLATGQTVASASQSSRDQDDSFSSNSHSFIVSTDRVSEIDAIVEVDEYAVTQ